MNNIKQGIMKAKYPLHVSISEKGILEQFENIFTGKNMSKQLKGQSKHNYKRKFGNHPKGIRK